MRRLARDQLVGLIGGPISLSVVILLGRCTCCSDVMVSQRIYAELRALATWTLPLTEGRADTGTKKDVFRVSSEKLVGKVREIVQDASVKKITIKDQKGKVLLTIPVTWGAAGVIATVVLAPWLAALGAIVALAAKCTIEVEREPTKKG